MTSKSSKSYPFEQSLEKLEGLVEKMEAGDLTLEDSLKTFEEGIRLTRECQLALTQAEQKVKILIEQNGQLDSQVFDSRPAPDA
ncbi:MAG: exodeoxyribonuclease VII small subunit [Pseudomonadales bacterium]|jgi:exodeoxyribonuclease VII small subunit|nr:exodeoxyribonuclease VII small subunit [Pseudomonadales bacterium]MDP4765729.1 exodeoxyribonuclease VII small subunit [Pseudomonadales bacterium]MDP5060123.1 exodeoxyribonuclease VII small subunit [Pseudomonadales bacterium]